MAYTPTMWKTGDTVTAANLNKLEEGVANAGGVLSIEMTYDTESYVTTLNKTFGEIKQAFIAGKPIICYLQDELTEYHAVLSVTVGYETPEAGGSVVISGYELSFFATSDDAFPTDGSGAIGY